MPLARIISQSSVGCRELAMDLLARGYAVEIVEPDKVPDNFADLELRVEPPAKSVPANVAIDNRVQSTPLDFVRHLKEPMPNFLRRPPTRDDLIAAGIITGPGPTAVAEIKPHPRVVAEISPQQQKAVGEIRSVAVNQPPTAVIGSPIPQKKVVAEFTPMPVSDHALANATPLIPKQEIPLITQPSQVLAPTISLEPVRTPAKETAKRSWAGITIRIQHSRLQESVQKVISNAFVRSNGAFSRASAGFAATVALGGVLLVGVRGTDPMIERATANSQNEDAKAILLPRSELQSAIAVPPRNSTPVPQTAGRGAAQSLVVSKAGSAKEKTKAETSQARDLKREAPMVQHDRPSPKSTIAAGQKQSRHYHGDGLVAKDTVTYLRK